MNQDPGSRREPFGFFDVEAARRHAELRRSALRRQIAGGPDVVEKHVEMDGGQALSAMQCGVSLYRRLLDRLLRKPSDQGVGGNDV